MWTIETTFFTQGNTKPATIGKHKGKVFAASDIVTKRMVLSVTEDKAKELASKWNKENEGNPRGATYKAVPL